MKKSLFIMLLLMCVFALPVAHAQAILKADTYTSASGGSPNGAQKNLVLSPDSTVYVLFDLSSVANARLSGADVHNVRLVLYTSKVFAAGGLTVCRVAGQWKEAELTTKNEPPSVCSSGTSATILANETDQFVGVDVTDIVSAWLNGTAPNYGFAIKAAPGSVLSVGFDSKENAVTSHNAALQFATTGATLESNIFTGNQTINGALSSTSISIGNGTAIDKHLSALSKIVVSGGKKMYHVRVPGAMVGDTVALGPSPELGALGFTGYVFGADTVELIANSLAADLPSTVGTIRVDVWHHTAAVALDFEPKISINPIHPVIVNPPNCQLGTSCQNQGFIVANQSVDGIYPEITHVAVESNHSIPFDFTDECTGKVLTTDTCKVVVRTLGQPDLALDEANIVFTVAGAAAPTKAPLKLLVTDKPFYLLEPRHTDFGDQAVGTQSFPYTDFTIKNLTAATSQLDVTTTGDFYVVMNPYAPAWKTALFRLLFQPTEVGPRTGTLTIRDRGTGYTETYQLTGNGIQPE